jgi:lysophospholipase L1-like esterase
MIALQANRLTWPLLLLRCTAAACAVAMGEMVGIPAFGLGALGLLGVASAVAQTPSIAGRQRLCAGGLVLAGLCSLLAAYGLWTVRGGILSSNYYSFLAWLVTLTILPPGRGDGGGWLPSAWKGLGLLWAFWGGFVWLAESYAQNLPAEFYAGLAINLFLLLLGKRMFRLRPLALHAINTLILLLVVLPVVDLSLRWFTHPAPGAEPREKLYLYGNGGRDPAGYARWCASFDANWHKVFVDIFVPDPAGTLLMRPKANSQARFFDSPITINSLGFRGKEVSREKGNAYRIVALGESTTFGFTMNQNDQPWPELLEQMIRERLRPPQPVEVINAGIPSWTLQANLGRLATEILPLHPDMIISYHGYNGFSMIQGVVPLSNSLDPPVYKRRPLKLLADCEYRLKVMNAVRREQALLATRASSFADPLQTRYAEAYRQLIRFAQTNNIRLVLADYSMAANESTPRRVVNFYRGRFPAVVWWIKANEVHSMIVRQLAQQHPEVRFVDTHPNLDGDNDKFIDLMHFTQDGRQQLAETIFANIRAVLERDLAVPAQAKDPAVEPKR